MNFAYCDTNYSEKNTYNFRTSLKYDKKNLILQIACNSLNPIYFSQIVKYVPQQTHLKFY